MKIEMEEREAAEAMVPPAVAPAPHEPPGKGSRIRQYVAALAASMGAMAAGTELAWTSPALPVLKGEGTPLAEPLSETQGAWVGALLAVGALAGALPGGFLAERFGRRRTLAAIALPFVVSWAVVYFATTPSALYIARLLAGVGTGAASVVAPVYVGEVAEPAIRGALGSGFQLLVTVGILFVYVFGALLSHGGLAVACALPPLLLLAGVLLFAPESPAYLVRIGREGDARAALRVLRGAGADVEATLRELRAEAAAAEGAGKKSVKDVMATATRRRALLVSLGLMACQQLSGINAVIFYLQDIFAGAGSTLPADASACLAGTVQVAATLVAALLVDRAGRRPLLLLSACVMALCLVTLGFCFKFDTLPGSLSLIAVGVYLIVFSLGFGPLPWMMMGEVFAPEVKGEASGLAVMVNWLIVFGVTFAFGPVAQALGGHAVFWFFAVVCGVATCFVFFLVPETKGKSLQEIQDSLGASRENRS